MDPAENWSRHTLGTSGIVRMNQNNQETNERINVIFRRVRVSTIAVGKKSLTYSKCVCVKTYLSSKQCAFSFLYCHLCSVDCTIFFPQNLKNGKIFEKKKIVNTKYEF
jgi:hypothetical protein